MSITPKTRLKPLSRTAGEGAEPAGLTRGEAGEGGRLKKTLTHPALWAGSPLSRNAGEGCS
jgi:hypothetical protein